MGMGSVFRALSQLFQYIFLVAGEPSFGSLRQKIIHHLPQAKETLMTIAEALRKEGREEGRKEAMRKVLTIQLELRFGRPTADSLAKLELATESELEHYAERLLVVDTASAVFV